MDFSGRNIMSIQDFSRDELEHIFKIASDMEKFVKTGSDILKNKILANLFFEPSTRTRLFGHTIEGSVTLAAEYSNVPIINAGSGTLGHPTQAMLDLFSILREKNTIDGLTVGILGDLKYGRTVKSLAYGLANYDVKLVFVAPEQLRMRRDVLEDLSEEGKSIREVSDLDEVISDLDVLYVTRIQEERFPDPSEYEKVKGYFRINRRTLKSAKDDLIVFHPLPRVGEISTDIDSTRHARYFKQSSYGLLVRMALLSLILS